ncbi:hypothetical protein ACSBR2_028792 [Camellia fascicularis]
MMNHSLLSPLVLVIYFSCLNHVLAQPFTRFQVHIISAVPDTPSPLLICCQSKDDDFGVHLVYNGQEFRWSFKLNFLETTRYFCRF